MTPQMLATKKYILQYKNIRFLVPARNDGTNASDKKNTFYSP